MTALNLDYLPKNTKELFENMASLRFMNRFALVGGTALAMQIHHRQSEDLDFIADSQTINTVNIKRNLFRAFNDIRVIREENDYQIDVVVKGIKVTFFSAGAVLINFSVLSNSVRYKSLFIARPETIAVLKMSAIAQRNTLRDYYDLYFLSRYFIPLEQIILKTKELVPSLSPVTYTETLIYTGDLTEDSLSEHLNPKEIVDKEYLADWFRNELSKFIDKI